MNLSDKELRMLAKASAPPAEGLDAQWDPIVHELVRLAQEGRRFRSALEVIASGRVLTEAWESRDLAGVNVISAQKFAQKALEEGPTS